MTTDWLSILITPFFLEVHQIVISRSCQLFCIEACIQVPKNVNLICTCIVLCCLFFLYWISGYSKIFPFLFNLELTSNLKKNCKMSAKNFFCPELFQSVLPVICPVTHARTLLCVFPTNNNILSHKHNTTITTRMLTMVHYYSLTPRAHSHFTKGPQNVLAKESNSGSYPVWGFHPSLVSFSLEHFLSLSLTCRTIFDGNRPGIL